MELLLIRHGNTFERGETPVMVGAATDLPLTLTGKQQAKTLAARLAELALTPDLLIAGPLLRHQQSAEPIAKVFDLQITGSALLSELDYGMWEGEDPTTLKHDPAFHDYEKYGIWPPFFRAHAHMNQTDFQTACNNWLAQLAQEGYTRVALVTSQGVIRLLASLNASCVADLQAGKAQEYKVRTGAFCHCRYEAANKTLAILQWNQR